MIKIIFIIFVIYIMGRNFFAWMSIDKKIGAALKWKTADAELLDYQIIEKSGKGLKRFQNNRQYFAYASFQMDGKTIGCQKISFYADSHIINQDFLTELSGETQIKVWYNPESPGDTVMLNPENHGRNIFMAKTLAIQASCITTITLALLV